MRAQYFPRAGETDWLETVDREVKTVRTAVGVCDVSTLGKIDVQGARRGRVPRSRLHQHASRRCPSARRATALMLREDGFVLDDGTTARLSAERFVMTTTTANAVQVMQHLEFCHQVLWPELDVQIVSVIGAMGAVRGRRAARARRRCASWSMRNSTSPTRHFPYLACAK